VSEHLRKLVRGHETSNQESSEDISLRESRPRLGGGSQVQPPWTPDEVASLNGYQNSSFFEDATCGQDGCKEKLSPTRDGWICPVHQLIEDNWAQFYMLNGDWAEIEKKVAACGYSRMSDLGKGYIDPSERPVLAKLEVMERFRAEIGDKLSASVVEALLEFVDSLGHGRVSNRCRKLLGVEVPA
jgi:hypothetical protein